MYRRRIGWTPGCSGALAGLLNGFLGAGGGVILVPLLRGVHHLPEKTALATSLSIMLPLTAISALIYGLQGQLCWQAALPYGLGGIIGGYFAGKWLHRLPAGWLRRGFGLLLMAAGARMLLS